MAAPLYFDEFGRPFIILRVRGALIGAPVAYPARAWPCLGAPANAQPRPRPACAAWSMTSHERRVAAARPSRQPALLGRLRRPRCDVPARLLPRHHPPPPPHVLQEQDKKSRVKGVEAVKANIQAAKAVSRVLRTSLGPKGMDKLLQGPDGDIVISACRGRAGRGGGGGLGGAAGGW